VVVYSPMTFYRYRIVVLGAGITGLTVAWELLKRFPGQVIVLEKANAVGGLAGTFSREKLSFDPGSHRLHDGYEPAVGDLIKSLLGEDLLKRERRGCIFLNDRGIPYPPSALDIITAFGARDLLRFTRDLVSSRLSAWAKHEEPADFESFTISKVGRSLYERFYRPYAMKLYGMSPKQLSRDPAVHRVRKFSWRQMHRDIRKRMSRQPSYYYYPRNGIGQLNETLRQRITQNGDRLFCASTIQKLRIGQDERIHRISFSNSEQEEHTIETELVISTIPLNALYHSIELETGELPPLELKWRGLRLLYLTIGERLSGESETYYFPESVVPFGRVSELHRYSPSLNVDENRTVLTIEVPCSPGDQMWSMPDDELAGQCLRGLKRIGLLPENGNERDEAFSVRLQGVYPVYELGWRERFDRAYNRLDAIENLYMIGRSALFLHCNIDHCMFMAIKLAEHLENSGARKTEWRPIQRDFFNYRVRE
jgi:protoporphyrinogen oxidase